jgi:O-antigen/teichoic acid export membrane protein
VEIILNTIRKIYEYLDERQLTVIKGSLGSFAAKSGRVGLSFVIQVILARILGKGSFGIYSYVIGWIGVAFLVGNFGFKTASVRFVSEYLSNLKIRRLKSYLSFSRKFVAYCSIFTSLIFTLVYVCFVRGGELLYAFLVATPLIIIHAKATIAGAELRGLKEVVRAQVPRSVLQRLLVLGGLLIVWWIGAEISAPGAIAIKLVSMAGALVILLWLVQAHMPDSLSQVEQEIVLRERKWYWVITARDMLLISSFNLVLFRADILMVGAIIDPATSGVYKIASRIASVLVFGLASVNSILSPVISDLYSQGKKAEMEKIMLHSARGVFVITLFMAIVIYIFRVNIIGIFGADFIAAEKALVPLLVGQISNSFAGPAIISLNMTGKQKLSTIILGSSAVLNIVLNIVMINAFGMIGAAISTMISTIIWNALAVLAVRSELNIGSTALG